MTRDLVMELRSAAAYGVVTAVRDNGSEQVVDVEILPGVIRSNVRVLQPFGFASRATTDGAVVMLVQVGSDAANLAALPVTRPGARFGNLAEGEAVVYGGAGQRIAMRADGSVEILAATEVRINSEAEVHVSGTHIRITADVHVTGNLHVSGTIGH